MIARTNLHATQPAILGEIYGQTLLPRKSTTQRLEEKHRRQAIENLLTTCGANTEHAHRIAFLALRLYDHLRSLRSDHPIGSHERLWLEEASLLHDVGAVEGEQGHHKASLRLILSTPLLRFSGYERLIVGSIARYHRRALPSLAHDHYCALHAEDRVTVDLLAALLRIAEGLSGSNQCQVEDLAFSIKPHKVIVHYCVPGLGPSACPTAEERADLFEQTYGRNIVFRRRKV